MNQTEITNEESSNYVEFLIYRFPKKNEERMLQVIKKSLDSFRKEDVKYDYFKLVYRDIPGFTNITKTISATPDEEVWMDYYFETKNTEMNLWLKCLMIKSVRLVIKSL